MYIVLRFWRSYFGLLLLSTAVQQVRTDLPTKYEQNWCKKYIFHSLPGLRTWPMINLAVLISINVVLQVFAKVDGFTTLEIHKLTVMIQFRSIHIFLGAQKTLDSRFQIRLAFRSKMQVLVWFFQSYGKLEWIKPTQFIHEIHLQNAANLPHLLPTYLANELRRIQSFYAAGTSKRVALIDMILCHCLPCIPTVQYFNISSWHVIWLNIDYENQLKPPSDRSKKSISSYYTCIFQKMWYKIPSFIQFWGLFGCIFGMIRPMNYIKIEFKTVDIGSNPTKNYIVQHYIYNVPRCSTMY